MNGVRRHVDDAILVCQDYELLKRDETLPMGAQGAVVDRVEYLAVNWITLPYRSDRQSLFVKHLRDLSSDREQNCNGRIRVRAHCLFHGCDRP